MPSVSTLELLSGAAEAVFSSVASWEHFQQAMYQNFKQTLPSARFHIIPLALGRQWLHRDCAESAAREQTRLLARQELGLPPHSYIVLNVGQVTSHAAQGTLASHGHLLPITC